jgi:hypothetical protein
MENIQLDRISEFELHVRYWSSKRAIPFPLISSLLHGISELISEFYEKKEELEWVTSLRKLLYDKAELYSKPEFVPFN